MMGAKKPIFLDTNIVLCYNTLEMPGHERVRIAVEKLLRLDYELWISRQVLREFSAVLTRPQTFMNPLTSQEVARRVRILMPIFKVADETVDITNQLLSLMDTYAMGGKQVHDANIVATMQIYKIPTLFTLNDVDFNRFQSLITIMTLDQLENMM